MPDTPPLNIAGLSNAHGVPDEPDETHTRPPPSTPSQLPSGDERLHYLGARPRRPTLPPGPPLTRQIAVRTPEDAERRLMLPPHPGQLTRTLGQRWTPADVQPWTSEDRHGIPSAGPSLASTSQAQPSSSAPPPEKPFAQEMREWAGSWEADKAVWYDGWRDATASMRGIETDARLALKFTADILTSTERDERPTLELVFTPCPELPPDLSRFAHLKNLSIMYAGLQALPESIDALRDLHGLTLNSNPLQKLPDALAGLTELRSLEITNCPLLTELPSPLASRDPTTHRRQGLINLETLTMRQTGLTELPDGVKYMRNLKSLKLDRSPVRTLPNDIERLDKLRILSLKDTAIRQLPPTLGMLKDLRSLDLQNCTQLTSLPANIGSLKSLRNLDLRGCTQLRTLPESIQELDHRCKIQVPPHLQAQLDRLAPVDPVVAARAKKIAQIDTVSQWLMDQVLSEGKNPFVQGSPPIDPAPDAAQQRMTLGQLPALGTLLWESHDQELQEHVGRNRKMEENNTFDEVNVANVSEALAAWRARELAVAEKPQLKDLFPPLFVDLPQDLRSEIRWREPDGTDAPDEGEPSSPIRPR